MENDIKIRDKLLSSTCYDLENQRVNLQKYVPNHRYIYLKSKSEKADLLIIGKIYVIEGTGAGLIPGMVIGTALCPGIGTVIGGIFGGLSGLVGGLKIEEKFHEVSREVEKETNKDNPYELFKEKFMSFSGLTHAFCNLSRNFMKKPCYLPTSSLLYEKEVLIDHINKHKNCPATYEDASINDIQEHGQVLLDIIYSSEVVLKQGSFLKYFEESERPMMENLHNDCQKNYAKFLSRNMSK